MKKKYSTAVWVTPPTHKLMSTRNPHSARETKTKATKPFPSKERRRIVWGKSQTHSPERRHFRSNTSGYFSDLKWILLSWQSIPSYSAFLTQGCFKSLLSLKLKRLLIKEARFRRRATLRVHSRYSVAARLAQVEAITRQNTAQAVPSDWNSWSATGLAVSEWLWAVCTVRQLIRQPLEKVFWKFYLDWLQIFTWHKRC